MERPSQSTGGMSREGEASWRSDSSCNIMALEGRYHVWGALAPRLAPALSASAPKPFAYALPAPCFWGRSKAFGVSP